MTGASPLASFPSSVSSPRLVRQWIQTQLAEAGADDDAISDLRLVASELCANAVEHVDAGSIDARITVDDPMWWMLSLTYRAGDSPPPISTWTVADPDAASGRGLGIVRSLIDRVEIASDDDSLTITCWRRRRPG